MYLKTIFVLTLFIFTMNSNTSEADTIYGSMSCKLLKQIVTNLTDGKVDIYDGFSDGIKIGDYRTLSYYFDANNGEISMKLENKIIMDDFELSFEEVTGIIDKTKSEKKDYTDGVELRLQNDRYAHLELYGDMMWFGDSPFYRYYRDDWMGVTSSVINGSQIQNTIEYWDCRNNGGSSLNDLREFLISNLEY